VRGATSEDVIQYLTFVSRVNVKTSTGLHPRRLHACDDLRADRSLRVEQHFSLINYGGVLDRDLVFFPWLKG
jgi:hypothetical protein